MPITEAVFRFSADRIARSERLLELSASSATAPTRSSDFASIKNKIAEELFKNIPAGLGAGLVEFAARFINDHILLVFLKQFRDAQNTRQACYQKLIEAPLKLEIFYEGGLFPEPYRLEIASLESHPLAQYLGLEEAGQDSTLGAWMRVDFVLNNGLEV